MKEEKSTNQEENIEKPASAQGFGEAKEENKLQELEKKCEEYLNNWKRSAADFINYKKGELERVGLLTGYAKEDMFLGILPVLDSIYLAKKHMPDGAAWTDGFSQIEKQIKEFLKKDGIEEIKTVGEQFDPETMEIVAASAESSGEPKEVVVEELQKGYTMHTKVIRPAKVKVSK